MTDPRENLDLLSDILQVVNFYLLMKDANNNQIMQELQKQDTEYFEKIIKDIKCLTNDMEKVKDKLGIE